MLWKEAFSSQTAFHATALAYTRRCFLFPFENRRASDRSERGARERGPPSPCALAVNSPPGFYFHSRSMISKWPKKKLPALKKIFNMAYNAEKNLTSLYVKKKNSISRDLGKHILTQTKTPIPPAFKSEMVEPSRENRGSVNRLLLTRDVREAKRLRCIYGVAVERK